MDPIAEFIGQQLHSISNIDAGMMPKKTRGGRRPVGWWPYQHHKKTRSFNVSSMEDRLIGAIDKSRKKRVTRQDVVVDLLGKGFKKKEIADLLGVEVHTISRDVKRLKGRLKLCLDRSKKSPIV